MAGKQQGTSVFKVVIKVQKLGLDGELETVLQTTVNVEDNVLGQVKQKASAKKEEWTTLAAKAVVSAMSQLESWSKAQKEATEASLGKRTGKNETK